MQLKLGALNARRPGTPGSGRAASSRSLRLCRWVLRCCFGSLDHPAQFFAGAFRYEFPLVGQVVLGREPSAGVSRGSTIVLSFLGYAEALFLAVCRFGVVRNRHRSAQCNNACDCRLNQVFLGTQVRPLLVFQLPAQCRRFAMTHGVQLAPYVRRTPGRGAIPLLTPATALLPAAQGKDQHIPPEFPHRLRGQSGSLSAAHMPSSRVRLNTFSGKGPRKSPEGVQT